MSISELVRCYTFLPHMFVASVKLVEDFVDFSPRYASLILLVMNDLRFLLLLLILDWSTYQEERESVNENYQSDKTSSTVGAATRIAKHRLRIAGRTRDVDWQQRINRQETTYFSIVRRRACWASRVNLSASTSKITITDLIKMNITPSIDRAINRFIISIPLNDRCSFWLIWRVDAIVLINSWITTRS